MTTDPTDSAKKPDSGARSDADESAADEAMPARVGPAPPEDGEGGGEARGKGDYKAAIAKLRQPIQREGAAGVPTPPGTRPTHHKPTSPEATKPGVSHLRHHGAAAAPAQKPHSATTVHVAPPARAIPASQHKLDPTAGTPPKHGPDRKPVPHASGHPAPVSNPIFDPAARKSVSDGATEAVASAILDHAPAAGKPSDTNAPVPSDASKRAFDRLKRAVRASATSQSAPDDTSTTPVASENKSQMQAAPAAPAKEEIASNETPDPVSTWRDLVSKSKPSSGKASEDGTEAAPPSPAHAEVSGPAENAAAGDGTPAPTETATGPGDSKKPEPGSDAAPAVATDETMSDGRGDAEADTGSDDGAGAEAGPQADATADPAPDAIESDETSNEAAPDDTPDDAETGHEPAAEQEQQQTPPSSDTSDVSRAAAALAKVVVKPAGDGSAGKQSSPASETGLAGAAALSRPKSRWRWPIRLLVVLIAIPLVAAALVYVRLLFGPVDLSFIKPNVEQAVRDSLPPDSSIELGSLTLSISSNFSPVLHFAPVSFTDNSTGAEIAIGALEIGVSPLQTLIGQPAAVVTLVEPRVQMLQDLLGPRLAAFTETEDPDTGETVVEVRSGRDTYPEVRIGTNGLQLTGPSPRGDGVGLRSDNEWMIYNFDAMQTSITDLETQAHEGRFARLQVKGGSMEVIDPVMSIVRRFDDLEARIVPGANGRPTTGTLGATLAGRTIAGSFTREHKAGGASRIEFSFDNLDYAALMPALDDPDALLAVKGGGTLAGTLDYGPDGMVEHGQFDLDLTGTKLRLRDDYYPVGAGRFSIDWDPQAARFELHEGRLAVGKSSTLISGEFALGLDDVYGPMMAMSLKLRDMALVPNDMTPPKTPFSEVDVSGWSAPLYGAIGLDRVVATKPGVEIRAKGRFDLVREGIGIDLEVGGEGASADDLKRLWPYFVAEDGRDWFVRHVVHGLVKNGTMRFALPVGSIDPDAEGQPLPANTAWIDLVGSDVTLIPIDGFKPIALGGDAKLTQRDNKTSVTIASTRIVSDRGQFTFANGAVQIDNGAPGQTVIEFSGDVDGQLPALVGFAESQSPGIVEGFGLPFDARKVSGSVDGSAVVTLTFGKGPDPLAVDFAVNGTASDFSSTERIADRVISDGQLNFQATPDAYHVAGTAALDGVAAELVLDGKGDEPAEIKVASTIDVDEFKKFGFDLSELMSGKIRFVARPLPDGGMQIAADLTEARLNLKDVGLGKSVGVPGTISAELHTIGTLTNVTQIDLAFARVRVKGALDFDSEKGLTWAEFSDFALSEGDQAQLSVEPVENGGYKVILVGDQFDLKPMLKRYFALDKTSTGSPQATSVDQELIVDARLKRALGFYGVTAYNTEFGLDLKGEDLLDASLQAQFTEGNTVSLTSNPTTGGRLMTVAFNDLGTVLRFLNIYPRLLGGSGSLTLRTDARASVDYGEVRLKNFSLVDEAKVAEILGNHKDSRKLIAEENRLNFQNAQVSFIRRSDRIELTDGVLDGGSIGGTLKGFIYTKTRQYDLTGTYIPLFGLNNMFQKLPIIGELLGGRQGEGLVGVTYAVRGDLDKPEFIINPASILAPGIFRSIFEFRATEAPREEQPQ